MSTFLDPAIARKSAIIDGALARTKNGIPLPSVIEISESGTCNRKCVFCPRSAPGFPDVKEFIDPALVDALSRQLGGLDYRGIFLFSGFVEPMLDKNIYALVEIVHRNASLARIEMVTNGDALNEARLHRLFASGLHTLLISIYDGPEAAERFRAMCRAVGLVENQYVIRNRYLPEDLQFGITLSNRAGTMDAARYAIPAPSEPLRVPCHYPHYTFFMDYNGDVLMCPHDWFKKRVVGNMKTEGFLDIWKGRLLMDARRRLAAADRAFPPCDRCDVKGTLMGAAHVRAWTQRDT